MRRKDREFTGTELIFSVLQTLPAGHLSMVDNGRPYGVTMNFSAEMENGCITLFFHGAKEGRKAEIWRRNPEVYFFADRDDGEKDVNVPGKDRYQTTHYVSVAGHGVMEEITDLTEKRKYLAALVAKYFPLPLGLLPKAMLEAVGVWKLVLKDPTGKANPPLKEHPDS